MKSTDERRPLRVAFEQFWRGFDSQTNYFTGLLERSFEVEIVDAIDAEIVVYSVFAPAPRNELHTATTGLRVLYTGENVRPNLERCDFAFTFDRLNHQRHYRLPIWATVFSTEHRGHYSDLVRGNEHDATVVLENKKRFCNFIYANATASERIDFFRKLNRYRRVDSGGTLMTTLPEPIVGRGGQSKIAFQSECKFSIAFENSSHPGYSTEKLLHAFLAKTIPIYWGDPTIALDFNHRAFVNCHDFHSFDAVVEHVREIDANDALAIEYLSQPPYHGNATPEFACEENVRGVLEHLVHEPSSK